jgi:hypothetical protein
LWAWVPTGEVEEVRPHNDLIKACKDGDLWAADEATALVCGVAFDPTFGGDHPDNVAIGDQEQS